MIPARSAHCHLIGRNIAITMPIYEFECEDCGERSEALVDVGTEAIECRHCGSAKTRRVLSAQAPSMRLVKSRGEAGRRNARTGAARPSSRRRGESAREKAVVEVAGAFSEAVPAEPAARRELLVQVYERASKCTLCPLSETRTRVVFGAGDADADLMFVGEGPGAEEDTGAAVRRPRRPAPERVAGRDRAGPGGGFHRQHGQVPPSRQPRPAAGRDRDLQPVSAEPGGADPAEGDRDARQLRDEAADRLADGNQPRPRRRPRSTPSGPAR